jgi:hypothetical protein
MYYDIIVNGKKRATVGHDDLENLSISVSGDNEGTFLLAGAVCREGSERHHLHWFQDDLADNDEILICKSSS